MGSVWFDGVEDLNRLSADLQSAGTRAGAAASTVVRRTALAVERDAKAFAPVDTANLRSSISMDLVSDGRSAAVEAVVGPTANYGAYVEFGTSRAAPRAYMGPALDRNAGAFADAIAQLGGDVL